MWVRINVREKLPAAKESKLGCFERMIFHRGLGALTLELLNDTYLGALKHIDRTVSGLFGASEAQRTLEELHRLEDL